jgi:hypothetical protein
MKYQIVIFAAGLLFACQSPQPSDNAGEAAKIHLEIIAIEGALAGKVDSLIQLRNQLAIQGRALTPEEIAFNNQVTGIETSMNYWRENLPEPPGLEHDHSHAGHDHHHHHGPALDVTPEQMLAIQKEFRDSILSIQQRISGLLQK